MRPNLKPLLGTYYFEPTESSTKRNRDMHVLIAVARCPHNSIVVTEIETCELCGAVMTYVGDQYDDNYSPEANEEWCKWLGSHFNQRRVVDWAATEEKFDVTRLALENAKDHTIIGLIAIAGIAAFVTVMSAIGG